ncbi:MAG: hypothetical protein J2P17_14390, partial [Mycobacterium sp.]|nr:hypothetical protein [Mycobacterium sp.]
LREDFVYAVAQRWDAQPDKPVGSNAAPLAVAVAVVDQAWPGRRTSLEVVPTPVLGHIRIRHAPTREDIECPACQGSGRNSDDTARCPDCFGDGVNAGCPDCDGNGWNDTGDDECETCGGNGCNPWL